MPLVTSEIKTKIINESLSQLPNTITSDVKDSLNELSKLHIKHHELQLEFEKEYLELTNKYLEKYKAIYKERSAILKNKLTTVPSFWLNALKRHNTIRTSIEMWDQPVLNYLIDIESDYLEPEIQKSFSLTFTFAVDNPYFKNKHLVKKFILEKDENTGEYLLVQSIGTNIEWYEGKNITVKYATKKQRSKNSREIRSITVKRSRPSFFNYFKTRSFPTNEELRIMTENEINKLENYLNVEYEIGQIIRDRIIPLALGWYLNIEYDSDEYESDTIENKNNCDELEEDK